MLFPITIHDINALITHEGYFTLKVIKAVGITDGINHT